MALRTQLATCSLLLTKKEREKERGERGEREERGGERWPLQIRIASCVWTVWPVCNQPCMVKGGQKAIYRADIKLPHAKVYFAINFLELSNTGSAYNYRVYLQRLMETILLYPVSSSRPLSYLWREREERKPLAGSPSLLAPNANTGQEGREREKDSFWGGEGKSKRCLPSPLSGWNSFVGTFAKGGYIHMCTRILKASL